jgi:RES domain-containing protein
MIVYRIAALPFCMDLSGKGAELYGGRWNNIGTPAIYSSQNISLALLEILCHTSFQKLPSNMQIVHIEIPAKIKIKNFGVDELPIDWNKSPASIVVKNFGTQLLQKKEFAAYSFPSAVLPNEINFMLNPQHKLYSNIKIIKTEPLPFDNRLVK